jgi:hypothetical protein
MATVNDVIMLTIVFLTCGYHVEFGLAPKNENSAIVDGNTTANSGERISGETIPAGTLRF